MPSATFFRLPQEKQERLLLAAQVEFTRVNFDEASINRIVKTAGVPRGSFYQYFEDKADIFSYLLENMRVNYVAKLHTALREAGGDMFRMPLIMFDLLIAPNGEPVEELAPGVRILHLNQTLDVQGLLSGKTETILPEILKLVDTSQLSRSDEKFVLNVFHLLIFSLVTAMTETLWHPQQRAQQLTDLRERIEIVRCGSAAITAAKEETK